MAEYPILATINYKNKYFKIEIPLRIKIIKFKIYSCKKCGDVGTLTNVCSYYSGNSGESTTFFRTGTSYPEDIYKSENHILCPKCLIINKEENELNYRIIGRYKIYTSTYPRYIRINQIIQNFTALRFSADNKYSFGKVSSYEKTLKSAKERANTMNVMLNRGGYQKNVNVIVKVNHKLTKKELEDCYDKYEQRKVIRKL